MYGDPVGRDEARSAFWDSWDRHFPDVDPRPEDAGGLLRYGERCMDRYLSACRRYRVEDVSAVGVPATLDLPSGDQVAVPVDILMFHNSTATVCRFVTGPGLRSASELSRDTEMRLCALWAFGNLAGCRGVRMRWEFLASGTSTEATAHRSDCESALRDVGETVADMSGTRDVLPRESEHCLECPYVRTCPRKLHENSLGQDPAAMDADEGVRLVDEYSELQERIDALRRRQSELESRRDSLAEEIVAFADANGFMAVTGHDGKALVRHETRAELPEDKTELIEVLRRKGLYDGLSIPNYSRIRSDVAKGVADPSVAALATVSRVDRVYFRRRR